MTDLTKRLRALSRHEHDDLSIGDEAAHETGSSSARLVLNLLDTMERRADELMAEWGFDREKVES